MFNDQIYIFTLSDFHNNINIIKDTKDWTYSVLFFSFLLHALGASQLLPELSNLLSPLHLRSSFHLLISLSRLSLGLSIGRILFGKSVESLSTLHCTHDQLSPIIIWCLKILKIRRIIQSVWVCAFFCS